MTAAVNVSGGAAESGASRWGLGFRLGRSAARRNKFKLILSAAAAPPIFRGCSVATAHTCGRPGTVDISPVDRAVLFPSRQPRHHALHQVTRSRPPHAGCVRRLTFGRQMKIGTQIPEERMTTLSPSESDAEIMTVKECVKDLFAESGGYKHVMVKLGVGQTRVFGFTDPNCEKDISFARVAALTSERATAAVRYLAQLAGGVFLPLPSREIAAVPALADAVREHAEAVAKTLSALADGRITAAEARPLLRELEESMAATAALHSAVKAIAEDAQ